MFFDLKNFSCYWKQPDSISEAECTKIKSSSHEKQLFKIYSKLSPGDRLRACFLNNISVPGIWPLLAKYPAKVGRNCSQYYDKSNIRLMKNFINGFRFTCHVNILDYDLFAIKSRIHFI